ncbi:MAG: ATP-dependent zinc protease [Pseudomonadota bacterium]|uniref:retropepsin-like aspartic peptidase RloA3 n=1 Tax=Alcanivorax sp. TaxID=1872427 RepID=UPI0024376962|nr:ATP-dependent zinc protease [Alcanivorax sp.]MEE3319971.1 ATP-dependent zinc protease [Pseudomonadota bacterium]
MQKTLIALTSLLLLCGTSQAMARKAVEPKNVYGWVEHTTLLPWGVKLKAKLDSGALTSSLHAIDVQTFERDGEKWVRFTVNVKDLDSGKMVAKTFEKPRFRRVLIRGAGGEERRPVVLMQLCMGDTLYEEQFTLNDRSDMNYPVLLGRRTLSHLGYLDVTETFLHNPTCTEESTVKQHKEEDDDEDIHD